MICGPRVEPLCAQLNYETKFLAAGRNRCGVVAASDFVTWQIRLRVGS
jgi:hypothetical protein